MSSCCNKRRTSSFAVGQFHSKILVAKVYTINWKPWSHIKNWKCDWKTAKRVHPIESRVTDWPILWNVMNRLVFMDHGIKHSTLDTKRSEKIDWHLSSGWYFIHGLLIYAFFSSDKMVDSLSCWVHSSSSSWSRSSLLSCLFRLAIAFGCFERTTYSAPSQFSNEGRQNLWEPQWYCLQAECVFVDVGVCVQRHFWLNAIWTINKFENIPKKGFKSLWNEYVHHVHWNAWQRKYFLGNTLRNLNYMKST